MPRNPTDLLATGQALWQTTAGCERDIMARTIADDLIEFGLSIAFYTSEAVLATQKATQDVQAVLHDIALRSLSADLALVTYSSDVRYPATTERTNRPLIWGHSSDAWQVRCHQCTLCEARA